jgi:hypothetical protein
MYPFWEVPVWTSGIFIALIATFHILPCHLATGAFWFNVFIERKALKENRPGLLDFIKRYTLMILIFCFVYGSLTGVGIWFAATVASPRSISALIHNYVWGWATEWVFFILEIVTIYIYYYTLDKVSPKTHMRIGWIYAWSAWISMVIITGILAFMLSSDSWIRTGGFFDGFFNSTYWPQLFSRTALMLGIAGLYAIISASGMENEKDRNDVIRSASIWGMAGMVFGGIFSAWFLYKMPEAAKGLGLSGGLPYLKNMLYAAVVCYALVFLYMLVAGLLRPQLAGKTLGILMLVVLFLGIGAGEGFREGVRRPYIISQFMYGNQIIAADVPAKAIKSEKELFKDGFLAHIYFVPDGLRTITPENEKAVGHIIARHQCGNCHTFDADGKMRALSGLFTRLGMTSKDDIAGWMDAMEGYAYMPPFLGSEEEKQAVAAFLASKMQK